VGTINVRSGHLQLDFRYRGVRCREQTKLTDTDRNRRRLIKLLQKIDAEITLGTFDYGKYFPNSPRAKNFRNHDRRLLALQSGTTRFDTFAESWLDENQIRWRPSYYSTISGTVDKYLVPRFGEQHLENITRAEILEFRSELRKRRMKNGRTLSADRVNHIISPLRMMLDEAALRYDFMSPMQGIKGLPVGRTDVEPFTLDEVNTIISTVRPDFRSYYTTRFFTGMRTGEIDGLQWHYVDFDRREILIRQALVNGELGPVKTDGSQREILMSDPVFEALRDQYDVTGKRAFVFCNQAGNQHCHRNVTKRVWYPILRHLGLRKRRPYQSRHTAATLWLASGENPEWVARQLGHTTTEMLFRRYSRFIPNVTRTDGSAFQRLLDRSLSQTNNEDNNG
jgi:integrase